MRVQGDYHFTASRSAVWVRLQDPDSLRSAIPGCVEFYEVGPDSYDMTVDVGIGPIRGAFDGNVTLKDRDPERMYTLLAQGAGRPGRITGEAQITLEEETEGTYLTYSADVKIRGAAARVGSRLLTAAVRSMARQFFDAIEVQAKTATEAGA